MLKIHLSSLFTMGLPHLWIKSSVNTDWCLTILIKIIPFCQSLFWFLLDVWIYTPLSDTFLYQNKISEPPIYEEDAFLSKYPIEHLRKVTSAPRTPLIVHIHSNTKCMRGQGYLKSYSNMTSWQELEFLAAILALFFHPSLQQGCESLHHSQVCVLAI